MKSLRGNPFVQIAVLSLLVGLVTANWILFLEHLVLIGLLVGVPLAVSAGVWYCAHKSCRSTAHQWNVAWATFPLASVAGWWLMSHVGSPPLAGIAGNVTSNPIAVLTIVAVVLIATGLVWSLILRIRSLEARLEAKLEAKLEDEGWSEPPFEP